MSIGKGLANSFSLPLSSAEAELFLLTLDLASSQIGDTSDQVEKAVTRVCESFRRIVQRTRQVSTATNTALRTPPDNGTDSSDDALHDAIETMRGLLNRIDASRQARARETAGQVQRIETIAQRVSRIESELTSMNQVVYTLRVLALNAQIESVRAGKRHAAFAAVATETVATAEKMKSLATTIQALVGELLTDVRTSTRTIRQTLVEEDRQSSADRSTAIESIDALTQARTRMTELVKSSLETTQSLGKDVWEAMSALQFQDAVSQQLAHVRESLEALRDRLDPASEDALSPEDWIASLRSRLTMNSERVHLDHQLGIDPTEESSPAGSVELF